MCEWRPIETAPHGKLVLSISEDGCYFFITRWHTGAISFIGDGFNPDGGQYYPPGANNKESPDYRLVGWSPLPEPPRNRR